MPIYYGDKLVNVDNTSVTAVNGQTGQVYLTASDIGAISSSEKGAADGIATLDGSGKILNNQLPANFGSEMKIVYNDEPTIATFYASVEVPENATEGDIWIKIVT